MAVLEEGKGGVVIGCPILIFSWNFFQGTTPMVIIPQISLKKILKCPFWRDEIFDNSVADRNKSESHMTHRMEGAEITGDVVDSWVGKVVFL